jgi:heptosyltransferase II
MPDRPRVAVIQPLPGIGDMVWHMPHIHALAQHFGTPVSLFTKPRSRADELLMTDASVADVTWVDRNPLGRRGEHDGPNGLWRLIRMLRARRFDAAVLLHHSPSLAFAALAAGIPSRQGYGIGAQRWFLNRPPYLPRAIMRTHQFQRATRFLAAAGIPMPESQPHLAVTDSSRDALRARIADKPRPFIAFGIGSSEPPRQWGAIRYAELADTLLSAGWPGVALVGGPQDEELVGWIHTTLGPLASRAWPALGWHLTEVTALLAEAAFLIGNNTGVMNMAAAVGIRSYGLFGTDPPFYHSPQIVPIVSPDGGPNDGVARVTLPAVLEAIIRDRGTIAPV